MSKYTFYANKISGDIDTLEGWRAEFEGMDIESWFGWKAEECDQDEWMNELEPIELTCDDEFSQTAILFHGCFSDARDGEAYIDEWAAYAHDDDGNQYKITYRFRVTKGDEPSDEDLPWDNEDYIWSIERVD